MVPLALCPEGYIVAHFVRVCELFIGEEVCLLHNLALIHRFVSFRQKLWEP